LNAPSRPSAGGRERGRGQALVEFALILPIFLLLFVGLFDVGRAVFTYNSLTNAAREGARLAIVNQDKPSIIQRAEAQSAMAELNVPNVTIDFYQENQDGTPDTSTPCPQSPPVAGQTHVAVGCLAVVSFEATYQPITPIISNLMFKNGVTFTAQSVLPVEFTCPDDVLAATDCPRQP
jgi:Flp pilus assembly protein TadG